MAQQPLSVSERNHVVIVSSPTRAPKPSTSESRYRLVAIGASAGGLKAVGEILSQLPPQSGCSIFVVIHLSPEHRSHAAEVLGRHTQWQVKQASEGEVIVRGIVYIAPPNLHLTVKKKKVCLAQTPVVHFVRPSVDRMFESVAAFYGPRCIGVVLSGSGSDGADGLRAVKAAGGFTIVEDPASAQFKPMPTAAVATTCADRVLPVEQIAALLGELCAMTA
jgi:two-component system, chemotaxis family, protein-glutamate methylesterase/glutaminase